MGSSKFVAKLDRNAGIPETPFVTGMGGKGSLAGVLALAVGI